MFCSCERLAHPHRGTGQWAAATVTCSHGPRGNGSAPRSRTRRARPLPRPRCGRFGAAPVLPGTPGSRDRAGRAQRPVRRPFRVCPASLHDGARRLLLPRPARVGARLPHGGPEPVEDPQGRDDHRPPHRRQRRPRDGRSRVVQLPGGVHDGGGVLGDVGQGGGRPARLPAEGRLRHLRRLPRRLPERRVGNLRGEHAAGAARCALPRACPRRTRSSTASSTSISFDILPQSYDPGGRSSAASSRTTIPRSA